MELDARLSWIIKISFHGACRVAHPLQVWQSFVADINFLARYQAPQCRRLSSQASTLPPISARLEMSSTPDLCDRKPRCSSADLTTSPQSQPSHYIAFLFFGYFLQPSLRCCCLWWEALGEHHVKTAIAHTQSMPSNVDFVSLGILLRVLTRSPSSTQLIHLHIVYPILRSYVWLLKPVRKAPFF